MKSLFATSVSFLRPIWSQGQGCYLISEEGKRYLDLESGTWCAIFGHGDQGLALALKKQAEDLAHCGSLYLSRTAIQATETLLSIAPPQFSSVVWLASGSEAMDWAMQIARLATGKRKFLVLDCGFLGSTDLPFRGSLPKKEDPDFTFLDTSKYLYNGDLNLEIDEETKKHINSQFKENAFAALVIEAIPVSGGINILPRSFLKVLEEACRKNGALLILDEVTCGMCRTGMWFGFQWFDLEPDIAVLGKALGSGYPVSALLMKEEVAREVQGKIGRVQSHQNDPLGAKAAIYVINRLKSEGFPERVQKMGKLLLKGLENLESIFPFLSHARGLGMLAALEVLNEDGKPSRERTVYFQSKALESGVLVGAKPALGLLRFLPPYIISQNEVEAALQVLEKVAKSIS
ncbi:MAG: aspartate aminotransferase family protein [Coprothermobacterota bacterium]|nr:aspartate aminotransferase family protein [Coprothermobacterota bacterium]